MPNGRGKYFEHLRAARARATHTPEEWQQMRRVYKNRCLRCKRRCDGRTLRLTKDHIIPVSACGDDSIRNIQPLCTRCNNRKKTKAIDYRPQWAETPAEYLPTADGREEVMPHAE